MKQFSGLCFVFNKRQFWVASLLLLISQTAWSYAPDKDAGKGSAPLVLSLGNRVFLDLNRNGIQDADDPGIANVTVRLFQSGIQRGQTTTDANGLYAFNSSNVSVGLQPNTPYEIRIFAADFPANLTLTRRNQGDVNTDSDAQLVGNQAVIFLTTDNSDAANDSYDFGFAAGDPDLNIIKSATASQVAQGSNTSFTIQVNNTGAGTAANVVVTDTLGAGIAYVSASPAPTITTTPQSQTVLTWNLGTLLSGSSSPGITLTINAVGEGVLYNTAYVRTTDTEANIQNNVSRACVTVPIILCPGDQYVASLPAEYTSVNWYRNAETTPVATGNSFTITQAGSYSFTTTSAVNCPANGCCPIIIEEGVVPTLAITPANPAICSGNSTTLTVSGCGTGTLLWSSGETTASIIVSPTSTTAGVYSVTCSPSSRGTCAGIASTTVTVNPNPVVTLSSTTVCVGATASLTAVGTGAPGLTYQFSAGLTPDPAQPGVATVVGSVSGTTSYTVTATSSDGCSATATGSVTVNPNPVVTLSSTTVCVGATASLTAVGTGAPGLTYQFSAGLTPDPAQPGVATVVGTAPGTTSYTVTATSSDGCSATATGSVTVNPNPVVTLSSTTVCVGATASLTAVGTGAPGLTYQFSAGLTPDPAQPGVATVVGSVSGTTSYTVTATSSDGCSATATGSVTVNPNPVVTLSSTTVCVGATASLTAVGTGAPGLTYQFSAGLTPDPAQPGVATVVGTAPGTTSYTVTATSSDGCSATATGSVTVNPNPVVTLSSTTVCVGATASLTAVGTGAPGLTYQFSAGLTPDPAQPGVATVVGTAPGTTSYTVTATSSDGCSATATGSVTVNPNPVVTLSSTTVCVGATASLTAVGTGAPGLTYQFSAGLTPDPAQPGVATVVGTAPGTTSYTVTATSSDGCSATATGSVTVNPNPVVTLSSTTVCVGATASLTAVGTGAPGLTYQFSAGLTPDPAQPGVATVVGTAPGTTSYTVTATSSDGCSATATGSVTVNPNPVVTLSSTTVCVGATASLTAVGTGAPGLTYQFSAGLTPDPAQPGVATVVGSVSGTTSYTVTATSSDGCSATATGSVTVNPNPVVTLSSTTVCVGATASLTAVGTGAPGLTYQFSAGLTPDPAQPGVATVVGTAPGTTSYTVTATSSDGCSATATGSVTVNPVPVAGLVVSSATICQGESTTLTASGGTTYLWSTGESTASITVTTSGIYSVTVGNEQGCTDVASTTVTVNPTPVLTVNSPTIFTGQSATLTVGGCEGGTVRWSTGETQASLVVAPLVTTTYSATCTLPTGCSSTTAATVTVNQGPTYTNAPVAIAATCNGAVANNNARIELTTLENTERVDVSIGTTYTGPAYGAASNVTVVNGNASILNLPNPASPQPYTVRLFSPGGVYFIDVTVTLNPAECICPAPKCVPVVIRKVR